MIYPEPVHEAIAIRGLPSLDLLGARRFGVPRAITIINLAGSPPVFHRSVIAAAVYSAKSRGIGFCDSRWDMDIADTLSDWCELACWARAAKEAGDERPRWCPESVWRDL